MTMPASATSGEAERASLEQVVPRIATTVGSAAIFVPAAWPPSALQRESSPSYWIGWPSNSPPLSSMAICPPLTFVWPNAAVAPDTVWIQAMWIGSPGAISTQPISSVHSNAAGASVGASVAGISVAGASVAGISVAGASVVAPPPHAASTRLVSINTESSVYKRFISFSSENLLVGNCILIDRIRRWLGGQCSALSASPPLNQDGRLWFSTRTLSRSCAIYKS